MQASDGLLRAQNGPCSFPAGDLAPTHRPHLLKLGASADGCSEGTRPPGPPSRAHRGRGEAPYARGQRDSWRCLGPAERAVLVFRWRTEMLVSPARKPISSRVAPACTLVTLRARRKLTRGLASPETSPGGFPPSVTVQNPRNPVACVGRQPASCRLGQPWPPWTRGGAGRQFRPHPMGQRRPAL